MKMKMTELGVAPLIAAIVLHYALFPLFAFTSAPGLALLLDSWLVLTASAVVYALFRVLAPGEDRWLKEKFGARYEEYRRRVLLKFF
jgi:protein-S-isoprenylcysteine O-methyltransferase Ste14